MSWNKMFILDSVKLMELARRQRPAYESADPFPHAVLDNFLPEEVVREVADSFPEPGEIGWHEFDNWRQKKLAFENEAQIEDKARWLLYQLNSSTFVDFLEALTGIAGLIPDPHFTGGGLHQIEPGGYLKIHADFNRHPRLKLDRRLNLLLFLNEDWKEEYGGCLELWNADMSQCVHKILPIFNRCVIFNTTDFSFHGHPDPLACPAERTRKSLALYYYSNGRPLEETTSEHGTLMRLRPGEKIAEANQNSLRVRLRSIARRFIPPIVDDARKLLSKR